MSLEALLERAEDDLEYENQSRSSEFGNTTITVMVNASLRKIKQKMNFERAAHKAKPEHLEQLTEALRLFKQVWHILCHPTTLFTTQHEKLFTEATEMWESYFLPSRWMEPVFRHPKGLALAEECVEALVFSVLRLLQARPSRESKFMKCVSGGCAAIITTVKATMTYRAQLQAELRVLTPPIETTAFLLRAEFLTFPLMESKWVLKNQACKKLSDAIRRAKRGFIQLYGQIVCEELLCASLLLRRGDPMVFQHSPYPLGVRPAFWSFWQLACGIYQASRKRNEHYALAAGKALLASIISQFCVQMKEWAEECSPEQKLSHCREIVVFVFFVRLWRDFIGKDLYKDMIHKPLFKVIVAAAIDHFPVPETDDQIVSGAIRAPKVKEPIDVQSANTAKFFAMIWAVPALSESEIELIIDQCTVPWSPQFPRAFSIESITSGFPIYITRHVRHRLRTTKK